ncbi:MAG: sulfur carrier protein ThiS [Blastocatellia bacterium]|nr:sulfur carrier protein ThiS [Blastocatellia bacterium]
MTVKIIVNGETREVESGLTAGALLDFLSLPKKRIAVELNSEVLRRSLWPSTEISAGDRLEVVHFVGGG